MDIINTISNSRIWNRHGLKIVYALAVSVCLLVIANITWNFHTHSKRKDADYSPQNIAPILKVKQQSYQVGDIIRANLFGNPNPKPVQKVITKTNLDLTLQGILAATDAKTARAIIKSSREKPQLYSVGENIKGANVSVEEIKYNEVLINRNGAIESIPLNKKGSSLASSILTASSKGASRSHSTLNNNNSATKNYDAPVSTGRSTPKPSSPNGQRRSVKKPDFSGLDRALKKMGEI